MALMFEREALGWHSRKVGEDKFACGRVGGILVVSKAGCRQPVGGQQALPFDRIVGCTGRVVERTQGGKRY